MTERTTSSHWASTIVQSLEQQGVDCRQLFEQLGMNYQALSDAEARFPQDGMTRLWQAAARVTGNCGLGLGLARVVRPSAFHVVGYALMSSRTLIEGIEQLVRYQRIIGEAADLTLHTHADEYELTLKIHGDRLPSSRESAEGSLAYFLAFCRWLGNRPLKPRRVRLCGVRPQDTRPYETLFQAPLEFDATHYALCFERADLDAELPTANAALAAVHQRFADDYLQRFNEGQLSHQVRQLLSRLLPQGEPRRESLAQALLMSERTLQRRLQEEGSTFHALLDDTRRTLAEQYLAQSGLSLQEISYLLGFSTPSTFFRAFRRWFGTTPNEHRASLGVAGNAA